MSHSAIYRELGVCGYQHVRARKERDGLHLTISQDRSRYCCSRCGSTKVHGKGSRPRSFRAPSIGQKPVWIDLDVPVVLCRSCHVEAQVRVPFAQPLKRYTRQFARQVLSLVEIATTQDVAHHLGVSWRLVRSIEQDHLDKHFAKPKLRSLQTMAIDMSKAYFWAVREHLKEAVVVFDHFHVIKLYNDKLTELRRQLYREATDLLQRNVLKGIRWLLLKNEENLDDAKRERQRLETALELNAPLATAYYLKDWLHEIWNQKCKEDAAVELEEWLQAAESAGIRMLTQFSKTLRTYRTGILNYYDYRISTGPLEGTNNKIKTLTRSAYGYRKKEYFKLKLYALHKTRYRLVG